jgi:hypothetical protein
MWASSGGEVKLIFSLETIEGQLPGCRLGTELFQYSFLQVVDQSGERCPPISTFWEFAKNCNTFLCDVCGADILHVRCHFKLKGAKKSTTSAQATSTRLSAAQPKRDWMWDVCCDCMQALRKGCPACRRSTCLGRSMWCKCTR